MRTTTRHRAAALVAAATLALGLAACSPEESGSSTSDAPASTAGTGTDSTAEAPATGGPVDAAAFEALIGTGPVADDATIEANAWAASVKAAGTLKIGGTETSELFSLLDPATGKTVGFDAGLAQLLSRYILGETKVDLQQVTSETREQLLESKTVDAVIATYSITPARAEKIAFAGPYYGSQAAILVRTDESGITDVKDLAGKKVATQANSTGVDLLKQEAPEAVVQALPDHAQCLQALQQGNVDAYVIDQTLLLNAVVKNSDVKIVGTPFGPKDLYGIGLNKDSDGAAFINDFLKKIESEGLWDQLWTLTIGDRTGVTDVPTPPTPGDTGL